MPISKKSIEQMAKALGVDKTALNDALTAETDIDIDIPEVKVLTPDGLRKLESEKYEEGKEVGVEMAVKKYKTENNIQFTGKGISDLAAHLESKSDVDGRVKKLQENLTAAEQKAVQFEQKLQTVEIENEIYNAIPAEYNGLSKRALKAIAEVDGNITFKKEDGKLNVYRDGQRVRDERTQADLPAVDVLKNFFEVERGFKVAGSEPPPQPPRQGRGGEGTPPKAASASRKRSDIEKEWTAANPELNVTGMEYQSHFAQQVKQAKEAGQPIEID
jgi:hypothetical protein